MPDDQPLFRRVCKDAQRPSAGNRVLMLHEKKIYANAAPEKNFTSPDAVVRQFVDGVADAKECLI